MSDHLTTALIILLASLPVTLPAAVLVLRWGFRTPGRPPGYRPRHRRPWWQWRRRKTAEFVGATADWSPVAEVEAVPVEPEAPYLSLAAVLEEVTDEQLRADLETAQILAETRAEMDAVWRKVEDAVIKDRIKTAAALARWERAPRPTYDRSAARDEWLTAPFETVTGPIDVTEWRALLDREGLVRA